MAKKINNAVENKNVVANIKPSYEVYETRDLTIFKDSGFNRPDHQNKALRDAIEEEGFNIFCPLLVDEKTMFLSDGHGRRREILALAEKHGWDIRNLPFPITFVFDNRDISVDLKIKQYNTRMKPWIASDFYNTLES